MKLNRDSYLILIKSTQQRQNKSGENNTTPSLNSVSDNGCWFSVNYNYWNYNVVSSKVTEENEKSSNRGLQRKDQKTIILTQKQK